MMKIVTSVMLIPIAVNSAFSTDQSCYPFSIEHHTIHEKTNNNNNNVIIQDGAVYS